MLLPSAKAKSANGSRVFTCMIRLKLEQTCEHHFLAFYPDFSTVKFMILNLYFVNNRFLMVYIYLVFFWGKWSGEGKGISGIYD